MGMIVVRTGRYLFGCAPGDAAGQTRCALSLELRDAASAWV